MTDAILASARELAGNAIIELRAVAAGLPGEALDWEPAGPDTNSITVLATHSMSATRLWFHIAAGLPPPARDREAEFQATAPDPADLLRLIDELAADCTVALDTIDTMDWSSPRHWNRSSGEVVEVSAAYALMHAVEHLRGHVDQASLTRHLWEELGVRT